MDTKNLAWASALMIIAIAFGAFGVHSLRSVLETSALSQWKTGVEYQFYHALGLLLVSTISSHIGGRVSKAIRWLFVSGIVCFSGSLYLLSIRGLVGSSELGTYLGPLTPIGGLLFTAGWVVLLITALGRADER